MNKNKFTKWLMKSIENSENMSYDTDRSDTQRIMLVAVSEYGREVLKLINEGMFDNE